VPNSRSYLEVDREILLPVLFNLDVDELIKELQLNGDSCYVGKFFIGCMYADDLLLYRLLSLVCRGCKILVLCMVLLIILCSIKANFLVFPLLV